MSRELDAAWEAYVKAHDIIEGIRTHNERMAFDAGFAAAQSQARDEALEEAVAAIERAWRVTPNEWTGSSITSFAQNAVGPGCQFAIGAIRALKASKP
jgi:hypothetical protein